VKTVFLYKANCIESAEIGDGNVTQSYLAQWSANVKANSGPAQRNGFYYPNSLFWAESDSVINSYQWRSPLVKTGGTAYLTNYIHNILTNPTTI